MYPNEKKKELAEKILQISNEELLSQLEQFLKSNSVTKGYSNILEPGRLKGKIIMSEDFDAPLEDFKDYM
jgi:hypothetical protein